MKIKSILTISILLLIFSTSKAMESANEMILPEQHYSLESIQNCCLALLDALEQQPLCVSNHSHSNVLTIKHYKVLPIQNFIYCRTIDIISSAIQEKLKENAQYKDIFDFVLEYTIRDTNQNRVNCGIQESFHNHINLELCPMSEFKNIFKSTISEITTGWRHSTVAEYPDILFTKQEPQWALLVKQKSIASEHVLFNCFLSLMKTGTKADCDSQWQLNSNNYNLLYLWIKQKHYERIIEALHLTIT